MIFQLLTILLIFATSTSTLKENIYDLQTEGIWVKWNSSMKGVPENAVYGGNNKHGTLYVIRADVGVTSFIGSYSSTRREGYIIYSGAPMIVHNFEIFTHINYLWHNSLGEPHQFINYPSIICRVNIIDIETWYTINGELQGGMCKFVYENEVRSYSDWETLKKNIDNMGIIDNMNNLKKISIDIPADCGKSFIGQGRIINGLPIIRNAYPWHAALIDEQERYFCGGTLVSPRKVVTAAHCLQNKHVIEIKSPEMFSIVLGAHDLNDKFEVGRIVKAVKKVEIHQDWDSLATDFSADIAMITLKTKAEFTAYVQPICLTDSNPEFSEFTHGIVIGYGKSENTNIMHENIPRLLNVPIQTEETCKRRDPVLSTLSSSHTFCAGTGEGEGVCGGDSGGGVYALEDNKYYLYGIVSASTLKNNTCDVNTFAIFTKVSSFNEWIRDRKL